MAASRSTSGNWKSSASLLAASLTIVLVWGWLLPWASTQPRVKRRLEFLDARGVDPSAMFYTELDAMDEILDRIEGRE
jgi:hypothetical protein